MSLWTKIRDAVIRPALGAVANTYLPGSGTLFQKSVTPVSLLPTSTLPGIGSTGGSLTLPTQYVQGRSTRRRKPGGISASQLKNFDRITGLLAKRCKTAPTCKRPAFARKRRAPARKAC